MSRARGGRKSRPLGRLRYKKIFNLICEGAKTEKEYFTWLKYQIEDHQINIVKRSVGKSAPQHLVKEASRVISSREGDCTWIILDVDQWTDQQFEIIEKWKNSRSNNFVAVSNPKFEYWILLHSKRDPGNLTDSECSQRFRIFMGTDKGINTSKLTLDSVRRASQRAKEKHVGSSDSRDLYRDVVPTTCGSTIYLLIEQLEIKQN